MLFDTSNAVVTLGARPEHTARPGWTIEVADHARLPFLEGHGGSGPVG